MIYPNYYRSAAIATSGSPLGAVRQRMASALIGQAVTLAVDAKTVAHGIVSGVLTEKDSPKIVVDGARYNFNQILTHSPIGFAH